MMQLSLKKVSRNLARGVKKNPSKKCSNTMTWKHFDLNMHMSSLETNKEKH